MPFLEEYRAHVVKIIHLAILSEYPDCGVSNGDVGAWLRKDKTRGYLFSVPLFKLAKIVGDTPEVAAQKICRRLS